MLRALLLGAVFAVSTNGMVYTHRNVLDMSWEEMWGAWRHQTPTTLKDWRANTPKPAKNQYFVDGRRWEDANTTTRHRWFEKCLEIQRKAFTRHVLTYRSPPLEDVRRNVLEELQAQNKTVTVAVFWGRGRYVSILWQYLERNLKVNHGIVDRLQLITKNRDAGEGEAVARGLLEAGIQKYGKGVVEEVPFCEPSYGCAYDRLLKEHNTVYIKLDDDLVFIRDGSFEHMVYQQLTNKEFAFFSASVVNNPHGYGIHAFAGAYPPVTYHWSNWSVTAQPPFINGSSTALGWYYGPNVYPFTGSRAHESFIYNAARGRLDMYNFDLFNLNECRCGRPQPGLDICMNGFYRWSINAFVFERETNAFFKTGRPTDKFDEPAVGIGWTVHSDRGRRVGVVGEALMVHMQFTRQRIGKPNAGLHEDIMLPWYHEFARQYMKKPYGAKWAGNETLLLDYESRAFAAGEERFNIRSRVTRKEGDVDRGRNIKMTYTRVRDNHE